VAKFTTLFGIISTLRQKDKDNCSRVATVLSDKLCETENRFCTIPVSSEQRDRIKAEFFEIEKKNFPILDLTDKIEYLGTKIPAFCTQISHGNYSDSIKVFEFPPISREAFIASLERIDLSVKDEKQTSVMREFKNFDVLKSQHNQKLDEILFEIKKKDILSLKDDPLKKIKSTPGEGINNTQEDIGKKIKKKLLHFLIKRILMIKYQKMK